MLQYLAPHNSLRISLCCLKVQSKEITNVITTQRLLQHFFDHDITHTHVSPSVGSYFLYFLFSAYLRSSEELSFSSFVACTAWTQAHSAMDVDM